MFRCPTLSSFLIISTLTLASNLSQALVVPGIPLDNKAAVGSREQESVLEGMAALRAGQYDKAEKSLLEANRINPTSVEPMLGLAWVAQSRGKTLLARDWMASAVAVAPGQAPVLQAQVRLLVEQGAPELAADSYRKAIITNPGVAQLRLDLASLYLDQLKKPAEAVSVLRELIRRHPETYAAYLSLGLALSSEGKFDEASSLLEEAGRRDASNHLAFHTLGLVALKQGQAERALLAFDQALSLRPDFAGAAIGRGDALAAQGKNDQAFEAYKRAAMLAPQSALPNAMRAQLFERLKRPDEAESAYREALHAEAGHLGVMNNLAALLAKRKIKLDEAQTLAQRAVNAAPARASYVDTLGLVQMAQGDAAGAVTSFEKALSLEPKNAGFRQRLTLAKAAIDRAPQALSLPAEDPVKQIGASLEAWRLAWESKDAGRYLAFYAKDFVAPDKKSRAAWEAERRVKLDKKGELQVRVLNPVFSVAGEVLMVDFDQQYKSSSYSDSARKQIEWVRESGEWRIRREVLR